MYVQCKCKLPAKLVDDYLIVCVCVLLLFSERVVAFLSRPVLPAALLPNGQQLFSANAICQ